VRRYYGADLVFAAESRGGVLCLSVPKCYYQLIACGRRAEERGATFVAHKEGAEATLQEGAMAIPPAS
jgi:hypothetical protein